MFTPPNHLRKRISPAWLALGIWLGIPLLVFAAADREVTNSTALVTVVSQLYRIGTAEPRATNCTVRLEGNICWVDQTRCLLGDSSGAVWVELGAANANIYKPGQHVVLTGTYTFAENRLSPRLLVDNDGVHSSAEQFGTAYLKAGKHPIIVGYFNETSDSVLELYYEGPDLTKQAVPNAILYRPGTGTNWLPGLEYRYFEGQWGRVPDFDKLTPARSGIATNFDASLCFQKDFVGLQFNGYIDIPTDGEYTFSTISDDGSRLWIGGPDIQIVATNDVPLQPIVPGQIFTAERWGEAEGTVTFVTRSERGAQLELEGDQGRLLAQVQSADPAQLIRFLGKRIRLVGLSEPTVNEQGQLITGQLWVPDLNTIALAKPSPAEWLALPNISIQTLTATHSGLPAKKLKQYALSSGNDYAARDPKDWEVLGSNNGGESWTLIDQRRDETFADRFQRRVFTVTNDTAYNCYRLKIDANSGIRPADLASYQFDMIQLGEIELIGPAESEVAFEADTEKIITAAGDFPPAETKEAAFDGNPRTKWLDRKTNTWIQVQYAWAVVPASRAIKVQGRVIEQQTNCLVMSDGETRLRVLLAQDTSLTPGQEVEAVGFVDRNGSDIRLAGAFVQAANNLATSTNDKTSENALVLTNIAQMLKLSRKEQSENIAVQIRGVVTCFIDAGEQAYMRTLKTIQDPTSGIGVHWGWSEQVRPGDLVEVKGYVNPWANTPVIGVLETTLLGHGTMPKPVHPSWEALRTGELDNQWIELHGVVHSGTNDHFLLRVKGGQMNVRVTPCDPRLIDQWIDASVTVRGVYHINYNRSFQILSFTVETPGMEFVQVDKPAPSDPFARSAVEATNVLRVDSLEELAHRAKISGVVTYSDARSCYLADPSGVVRARFASTHDLKPGDLVEAIGFPEAEGQIPSLTDALVRKVGMSKIPPAPRLSVRDIASGNREGQRVSLEATCLGQDIRGPYQVLELMTERQIFRASMATANGKLPAIMPGSRIDVTGVCRMDPGALGLAGQFSTSFELLMNEPSDVLVLQRPSWWNTTHTVTVFTLMAAVLSAAVAWIRTLRHKVEQRTQALRSEIDERKQIQDKLEAEIEERKRLELEKEKINQELLATSRRAGMAEVASGVLHNVGNVLNSVNVSASLITEKLYRSKASNIAKVASMLTEHSADLGKFLAHDDRGKKLPGYLTALSENISRDQNDLQSELAGLRSNIDHIKEIVAMQQDYARVSGIMETISVRDLIEDALKIHSGSYSRHGVELHREYADISAVTTDKHKVLQILVNLFQNAKYACDQTQRDDKAVIVRTRKIDGDRIVIQVADNGIGITRENLTRIFSYGFTTRQGGHGFGLHSGALAAKELGGSLTVQSDGPGKGATFTLELPIQRAS